MRQKIVLFLVGVCLLLALGGCGNKGPLVLPEEDEQENKRESGSS